MIGRCASALLAVLLTFGLCPADAAEPPCTIPDAALPSEPSLPALAKASAAGKPVRIVAIGSRSMARMGLRSLDEAYPAQLAAQLKQRDAFKAVTVADKARQGQVSKAVSDAISHDVLPERPTLVLWEVGAIEAMMNADPHDMAADLSRGLELLKSKQIDVILIDQPYFTAAASLMDLAPYLTAVQVAAEDAGVPLFSRYTAMRAWSEDDGLDLDNMTAEDRQHMAERVEFCIAEGLDAIVGRAMMAKAK